MTNNMISHEALKHMKVFSLACLLALLLLGAPQARADVSVGVEFFHDSLAPFGDWINVPDFGFCWRPTVVPVHWRPFTNGHWIFTDFGWTWASDFSWGWAPFHYGRWMELVPSDWVWVPDTVWSPAWVSWRFDDDFIGWCPLSPFARFDFNVGLRFRHGFRFFDDQFVFVRAGDFFNPIFPDVLIVRDRFPDLFPRIIKQTNIITNINFNFGRRSVVNFGLSSDFVGRVTHRAVSPIRVVEASVPGNVAVTDNGAAVSLFKPRVEVAKGSTVKDALASAIKTASLTSDQKPGGATTEGKAAQVMSGSGNEKKTAATHKTRGSDEKQAGSRIARGLASQEGKKSALRDAFAGTKSGSGKAQGENAQRSNAPKASSIMRGGATGSSENREQSPSKRTASLLKDGVRSSGQEPRSSLGKAGSTLRGDTESVSSGRESKLSRATKPAPREETARRESPSVSTRSSILNRDRGSTTSLSEARKPDSSSAVRRMFGSSASTAGSDRGREADRSSVSQWFSREPVRGTSRSGSMFGSDFARSPSMAEEPSHRSLRNDADVGRGLSASSLFAPPIGGRSSSAGSSFGNRSSFGLTREAPSIGSSGSSIFSRGMTGGFGGSSLSSSRSSSVGSSLGRSMGGFSTSGRGYSGGAALIMSGRRR